MTDQSADDDLVARAREGDGQAFAGLVERHHRPVFGLILRTLGNRARAEELTQEVFLRVYRGLRYFRGQAKLSTWIYRIAVNLCSEERAASGPRFRSTCRRGGGSADRSGWRRPGLRRD